MKNTTRSLRPFITGQGLRSFSGQYTFLHQPDGNVVLYKGVLPVWSTGTQGRISRTIAMQTDGNFVLYSNNDYPLWNTMTWSHHGARFAIQDDGNIVIYSESGVYLYGVDLDKIFEQL